MKKYILAIGLLFIFSGCASSNNNSMISLKESGKKAWKATKEGASNAWESTKEFTSKTYESAKKSINEATE